MTSSTSSSSYLSVVDLGNQDFLELFVVVVFFVLDPEVESEEEDDDDDDEEESESESEDDDESSSDEEEEPDEEDDDESSEELEDDDESSELEGDESDTTGFFFLGFVFDFEAAASALICSGSFPLLASVFEISRLKRSMISSSEMVMGLAIGFGGDLPFRTTGVSRYMRI